MNQVLQAVGALVPSAGVGLIFWLAIRAIFRADQRERVALRKFEAEQDAADAEARLAAARPDGFSDADELSRPAAWDDNP